MYRRWAKDFIRLPIFALRRKASYYKYYDFVEKAYYWDEETFTKWQWENVKKIVDYAYLHVPFYKKLYDSVGYKLGDLIEWKDFEILPSISKSDIKSHIEEFYSDEIGIIKHRTDYTGGSTSNPMKFYLDDDIYWREDAIYLHYWSLTGFNLGDRCVLLRGAKLIGDDKKFKTRYSPTWNYLVLDSSHICPEYLPYYDEALKSFRAENIQAYPSSLFLLAKTYISAGFTPPIFKRIYLGSENVYQEQVEMIRAVFKPEIVINQYGHTERVVLALQNLDEGGLGFVPYYGYMELLRPDKDLVISKPGITGEIVGTSITKSMPFIRYRTNDYTSLSEKSFEKSMKGWTRVDSLEGRLQEFVVTMDKRLVSTCTIAGAHIPELSLMFDMQYVQKKPGELLVNAIEYPENRLSLEKIRIIEEKLSDFFDKRMICKVVLANELKRTNRNKKMMLIQNLDIKEYL